MSHPSSCDGQAPATVGVRRVRAFAGAPTSGLAGTLRLALTSGLVRALHLALTSGLALAPGAAEGQTPASVAARCVEGGGDLQLCAAGATAARALMGHAALLASAGSPVPGSASNLGTRVGGGPRLSFHARLSASSWGLPATGSLVEAESSVVTGIHFGGAAGLFDGFRLLPTVGGFLATDVFADVSVLSPGENHGYSGGMTTYAIGARVGLIREGFTVPGASISIARRVSGSLGYGDAPAGDVIDVLIEPSTTSVRAAVSKDLFAVELLGGFGWDDASGDVTLRVPEGGGGTLLLTDAMSGSRRLYFGSAAMTFSLILTLTVEGGWAEGVSPVPGYTGAYDLTSGGAFGSFSARFVF